MQFVNERGEYNIRNHPGATGRNLVWHNNRSGYCGSSVGYEMRYIRGTASYARGRSEGVTTGGSMQEGPGEETMVTCGEIISDGIQGRYPSSGYRMVDNYPYPKREGIESVNPYF